MEHDPELAAALETSQFAAATRQKLPRRRLGRWTLVLLYALRIYVLLAVPVVGYAFVRALQAAP